MPQKVAGSQGQKSAHRTAGLAPAWLPARRRNGLDYRRSYLR